MWGWLTALVQGLLSGLNQWLAGQQAHADAISLGQQEQATADANVQNAVAQKDQLAGSAADAAADRVLLGGIADPSRLRDPGDPDSRD